MARTGVVIGKGAKEISPVIIQSGKRGIQKADNLNTNLGIYTKNIINQSTPKLENAYYGTKVFLYTPENIIKGMMGVEIANDVFNDGSPIPLTPIGTILSGIKNTDSLLNDKEKIKDIKNIFISNDINGNQ